MYKEISTLGCLDTWHANCCIAELEKDQRTQHIAEQERTCNTKKESIWVIKTSRHVVKCDASIAMYMEHEKNCRS